MRLDTADRETRIAASLLAIYLVIWVALAIRPYYREDWALENALVVISVPLLVRSWQRWRFSTTAYVCIFVFFVLHAIGAHYTYAEVPYDRWFRSLLGFSLDETLHFTRNHYDRFVHLCYGLLIAVPGVELLDRRAPPQGLWRWLLPIMFIASHSVIYETVEWLAALVFGGDLGVAYLGTQGDPWDAQEDMFLATSGAALSVCLLRWRRGR